MQVNQNVNAANFLLVSSQACNPSEIKTDAKSQTDFAGYLQDASMNQNSIKVSKVQNDSEIVTGTSASQNKDKDYSKEDAVATKATEISKKSENDSSEVKETMDKGNKTETKDAAETKKTTDEGSGNVEEADAVATTEEMEDAISVAEVLGKLEGLSEEELEGVLETVSNLLQSVMEQFNLTFDELSAKLEEFGMEVTDLLNPEGLKSFFLQMNNAEVSDLLVDEELNMQLQSFMDSVSEPLGELQVKVSDMETFIADEKIQSLINDYMAFDDVVEEKQLVTNTKELEMVMTEDEPEVIVDNQRLSDKNLANNSDESQHSNKQSTQMKSQESVVMESTANKQPTFENPILQGIQNAMNQVEGAIVSEQPVQQTDVLRQVVEQVRLNMNQQTTSLELQLYPEHLGRIQINVVSKEGVMTASIVAETEAAKQAIEAGLLNLKEAMEQHDLKIEAIEVMVSTTGFEKGDEQQSSFEENQTSNSRRKINLSELNDDVPVEDEAEIERMKATGSSVSYMA
ncbi:MAG: flagellar hook-length control protein FliK [Lachnospiraceae bacterium]|nr:flagellar hook-length control protein FliK [Lachnospiraceae bacterium]